MTTDDQEPAVASSAGQTVTKKYVTEHATKFELIGPGTAQIIRGAETTLTLTVPQSEGEHVEVKLEGDRLKVAHRGGLFRHREPDGPLQYELTIPILAELKLSNGLAAEATGIDNRDVSVEVKDGSSLTLAQLRATDFEAKIAGGGRLIASGAVGKQKVRLTDGANYQGGELRSEEADIEASGGSEATVTATKTLKAKATGGSTVSYGGDKVALNVQTADGSELRRLGG